MWISNMATLNGVEFGIVNKTTTVIHDNNVIDIPGSDTVVNDDAGYSTAPMSVTGHVKNESEFDDFKGEFYSGGELILIADPDSGKQYTLYASGNVTELDGDDTYPLTDIVFQCTFFMKYPYLESVLDITRTKTITTNNQEWSSDDDGNPLKTDGNVDAAPDIQITGGAVASTANRESGYSDTNTDATVYSNSNTSFTLEKTYTFTANSHYGWILNTVGMDIESCSSTHTGYGKVTYQAASLNGGSETDVPGASWSKINPSYQSFSVTDLDIECAANENLVVRFYLRTSSGLACARFKNLDCDILADRLDVCKESEVYNTSDSTVKSGVGNEIEPDMIFRINTGGTGTIEYGDDFTTDKYIDANWDVDGDTHDTVNDELDIADDGYLVYKIDTKYPIVGIPPLTSRINITSGTPTIQISSDGTTWYDIDTAIVDDVNTVYPLDSDVNLSLAGKSVFYFRFDCVKAAAATISIKSFELDIDIHTIYAKNPKITRGATASTFRCDQDAESGLNCEILLEYKNRWWA